MILKFAVSYPALSPGDFFDAADLMSLAFFDDADVFGGLHHGGESSRVEPGGAAVEGLDLEGAGCEVVLVDSGDFELATGAWSYCLCDLDDVVVVEIQSGDGVVALRVSGFSSMLTARLFSSNSTTPYAVGFDTW